MAQQVSSSNFGSSIIYEDRLPLKVERYAGEPENGELLRIGQQNEEVLRMVMSLDDVASTNKNDDSERNSDVQRLEFKVNLILDMLGELYSQNSNLPESTPIKLGAYAASWMIAETESPPALNDYVALNIYLTRRYPRPLVLFAQVVNVSECETGEKWVDVDLLSMPPQTLDALERFVFRQHRRFVAFSRRQSN